MVLRAVSQPAPSAQACRPGYSALECLCDAGTIRLAGFFPGLGSRAHYQNLGSTLLDCGVPEVTAIYREAAAALGLRRPDELLFTAENMPTGKLAQQGFVGAALLVHSLALNAYLQAHLGRRGIQVRVVAYTGESFGIISAAVASGSISVGDGVRIAYAFTPIMLVAANGADPGDPLAQQMATLLSDSVVHTEPRVPEPFHVVALKAHPDALGTILAGVEETFARTDVELHKHYSDAQMNVYVRAGVKQAFDLYLGRFPDTVVEDLKPPTTFLAHSQRMRGARRALQRFIEDASIAISEPRIPVVSNQRPGLLTTAAQVRDGILAIVDEVMASQATAKTLDGLASDVIIEFGLGGKSAQLLVDNHVQTPVLAYTAAPDATVLLEEVVTLVVRVRVALLELYSSGKEMEAEHTDLLRDLFRLAADDPFADQCLRQAIRRIICASMLPYDGLESAGFHRFLEVYQHTLRHRDSVDAAGGELVLRARLRKRLIGPRTELGQACIDFLVAHGDGATSHRTAFQTRTPEAVVFHFGRPVDLGCAEITRRLRLILDAQPSVRSAFDRLADRLGLSRDELTSPTSAPSAARTAVTCVFFQYWLLDLLRVHRPAMFSTDHYLSGSDPLGWGAALAASGAASIVEVGAACAAYLHHGTLTDEVRECIDRLLATLGDGDVPILSPEGVPLRTREDLEAATRAAFLDDAAGTRKRPIRLNGNCAIVALGSALNPADLDMGGPFHTHVVQVLSGRETWTRSLNHELDAFEEQCVLDLTEENELLRRHIRGIASRRILTSTVRSYLDIDETLVGLGTGGSESMTIFVVRDGESRVTVRKILSEGLITTRWDPRGASVMLPPFVKAKRQAEYLQAVPSSMKAHFPAVFGVLERRLQIPAHIRHTGNTTYHELIYEMSYAEGEEVSRFIAEHSPHPAVVARLYELILRFLQEKVHTKNRTPAPGRTLEESYFRKIEDRLGLCRQTAPRTFCRVLLDPEWIIINGVRYLNSSALLKKFRDHPEYHEVLEPRYHCLVVGDTNTENIKIADTSGLLQVHQLLAADAPQKQVDAALAAITIDSLGVTFLDPRAIGFQNSGRDTCDDPMYDAKPWHNSLGHYDEIRYEKFQLQVRVAEGRIPEVDIAFADDSPFQKAYRLRDAEARGRHVDTTGPEGMEDYFAPVMTAVYRRDEPSSRHHDDPFWLIRLVFLTGTHFLAMPPFHFQAEVDGTLTDTYHAQRRPVAVYCEGIKWLNWALSMLVGEKKDFLGVPVPDLPYPTPQH